MKMKRKRGKGRVETVKEVMFCLWQCFFMAIKMPGSSEKELIKYVNIFHNQNINISL